ncbi:lactonase family protein [Chitinophaga sedimenti]|uniref:lactonase family protein n=1 Tax=Chitinophaga sedimenti TaxID=2033606 RepID=UPI002003F449|nr:lactonase family protein [Chitinophaga sedimenti]MCK7556071.1 lactonase family protein [Chitinophaga sedimenti]
MLIGTYTSGESKGIYVYKLNTTTGKAEPVSVAEGLKDPSFVTVAPNGKFVYAASESRNSVYALSFDKASGKLQLLNEEKVGSGGPAHINMDKGGKFVFTGNYGGGSLSVLPVKADGHVGAPVQVIQMKGSGPDKARQREPHVHQVTFSPDGKQVFAPDLGTDKIMMYDFNPAAKEPLTPSAQPFAAIAPGGGPRHLVFHPNGKTAYIVHEMTGFVTAFTYADRKLTPIQTISTNTADYKGSNFGSADIHISPDGKYLYMTNRGDLNNIAIFKIDHGKLSLVGHESTQGKGPRNFMITPDGGLLLVANQQTNNIVVFRRDKHTGKLSDAGQTISVPAPVCVVLP